jgi:hypothetical protein
MRPSTTSSLCCGRIARHAASASPAATAGAATTAAVLRCLCTS